MSSEAEEGTGYDIGGIIAILFTITVLVILLLVAIGHATLSGPLTDILAIIIGYLLGRWQAV